MIETVIIYLILEQYETYLTFYKFPSIRVTDENKINIFIAKIINCLGHQT